MTISHCMHHALVISQKSRNQWRKAVLDLPTICQCPSDCGPPRNCRKRITDYLHMQIRIHEQHDASQGEA
ncbi:MAG TPA: hypothetical protein VFK31_09590 [Rhodanobacteraceae bacterium]|nr:hypothetical protein [Rhodanobacteraceae bacterium]